MSSRTAKKKANTRKKTKKKVTTRKRNNADVSRQILQQAIDAVVSIDENNLVTFFNRSAEELWGYRAEEVIGKNVAMLVPSEMQAGHDSFVNANRETGVDKIVGTSREVEVHCKDGSIVQASLSLSKVNVGNKIHYTAFVKDETESRLARETVRQTLEQALDAVVTIDENNNVTFFNKAAEEMWGYSRDEVVGKNVAMLVPKEMQAGHDSFVNANRETGVDKIVGTNREVDVYRKDGSVIKGSLSLSKVEVGGKIMYTAFVKDETEAYRSREIISQTLTQAIDAVVTIDNNNIVTFFNPAAEELWGYEAGEVVGKNVAMLVPKAIQSNHDAMVNANRTTGIDKIVGTSREVEVYHKSGELRWGNLALSKVTFGDEIIYTAFVKDVTEEVERRVQFETLSLVANKTDNSVIITDANGLIEYVNPGFTRMTGYEYDEAIGKKPGSILQGPDTDPETIKRISAQLSAQKPFYDEILNYTKGGEEYWISLAINPVFDDAGKLQRFISIQANVDTVKLSSLEFTAKLDAIDRANAVMEIDLAGKITLVNDNFMSALGQSMESQVIGRSFEELCTPGQETTAILNQVNAGQSVSRELSMQHKDGHQVWISLSVNPILDLRGNAIKAYVYGLDVTDRKALQQATEAVLAESKRVMESVADGDLSQRVQGTFDGDFGTLQNAINNCCSQLTKLVTQIRETSISIGDSAKTVAQGNTELSQRTEAQASSLEETACSMEEMTSTVRANADSANEANGLASDARAKAEAGGNVVNNAINAMNEINESSKRISDIIGVIDEIAFQTNLLALNAAVEAARAGEQGRGFAVVATEVRNLAQRSAEAAKEIKGLIKDSVQKVGEGTRLVNESGSTLGDIVGAITKVSEIVAQIADASAEQSEGINQIGDAVNQMDTMTQQNAAMVEETTSASESMNGEARALLELVEFFGTGDHQGSSAGPQVERRGADRPWSNPSSHGQHASPGNSTPVPQKQAVNGEIGSMDDEWAEF